MGHFTPFNAPDTTLLMASFIYTCSVEAFLIYLYQIRNCFTVPLQPPPVLTKQKRISPNLTDLRTGKECFNQTFSANFSSHFTYRSPFNFLLPPGNEAQKRSRLERFKDRSPQGAFSLHLGTCCPCPEEGAMLGLRELLLVLIPILIALTQRDRKISQSQKAI